MSTSPDADMSPDASPGDQSGRSGVRRVNNLPIYIVAGALGVFLLIMALVAWDRASSQQRGQKPADELRKGSTKMFAEEIAGGQKDGMVQAKAPGPPLLPTDPAPAAITAARPDNLDMPPLPPGSQVPMQNSTAPILASLLAASNPVMSAGIPVIDGANLSQNLITAIENVAHTLKQIQQYRTQLQQYENMLQNTTAPAQQIWDAANVTMRQLRTSIDTLNYYKASLGSVDAYLRRFKDTNGYRGSPCFSVNGCTQAQWQAMTESERLGSESQKRANDSLFRGLEQQQESLESDARQLERLQSAAQGANGQLAAIGHANQLASHQSNQLLQIRALLIAQQNVIATRNQALLDREAKESAAAAEFRAGTYGPSPVKYW